MNKRKYEIDMCNGPIMRKMLLFSIPLMCSSILQLLFNAADIVVVGKFAGDNALAAVGSNTALISLLTNLFLGLSIGGNVLAGRYYGAKEEKELSETVHTSMLLSVFSGLALTVIGIVGAKTILVWMQTPKEVLGLATIYLRVYFLGMTATMIYNFGSAILRAVGDTKRPLYYLFIAGIVNVILNLFFVIVLKMGVAGVGLATAISQCISALLVVRCLMREEGGMKLELNHLQIHPDKLKRVLAIGLPAGIQGLLFSLSNVVIQSSVNSFGPIVVAGNSAASNLEGFVFFAMDALYQATLCFTSQNMGAGNYKRINKILLTGQICVVVVGTLFGNLLVLLGHSLLGIYTSSSKVITAGVARLAVVSATYALCGMMDVMVGAIRGIGYSIMPMIVTLIGACGLRLVWIATIFQIPRFHSTFMVYVSYPITWLITFFIHVLCYIWAMKRLVKQ
ncbi:multi antimicrobial extrusion protein (Na(+)/drug antiporter), MATE family of MDR efflux pumps [Lachnospiraceae bacterium KM106-2]|nr:multi antimicrobial extrusion protein (Na(+)/drug antiporter), MATE family of MDR efflux pumps [Lachnospiraceae bacterium KM106-2]